jgi:C4-dicarboxylate-specific signal transduction histidine kinase
VSEEGAKSRIIGITIDVTETRRAQDALRATQSELARAARLTTMGELAASIAHEINQPLGAIVASGNAGMRWLANPTPDLNEARAALKRIVSNGHRASQVIASVRGMFKKDSDYLVRVIITSMISSGKSLRFYVARRFSFEGGRARLPGRVCQPWDE